MDLDTDLIEAMYDLAVEMAAREGEAAPFWRNYFPLLAEFGRLVSIGMLTATCCSDPRSNGGQTLKNALKKKTKATKGDSDATRVRLLNEALQRIAKADEEAGGVARAPGDLPWNAISKAVLQSDAFKEQDCFKSEYLAIGGGMYCWWKSIKKKPVRPYHLVSGMVVRIPGSK